MIQKIDTAKTPEYTSPNPLTLVCTRTSDGRMNLAPVCFFSHLSFEPPMVGFAMGKNSFTGETVKDTGKAVIAIPGTSLIPDIIRCGTSTGRDTDKADGMELIGLPGTDIMIPRDVKLAMCVSLDKVVEVGDHYLYACRVDSAYGDDSVTSLVAWDGFAKLAPARPE